MTGAGEALLEAAVAALKGLDGLGVHDGAPVQAAFPHALVEIGPEADWGHKSGAGREVRLAAVLKDAGERPVRLRRLMGEAEAAIAGLPSEVDGWRLVTMALLRTRLVRPSTSLGTSGPNGSWTGVIEFRARMLRVG